MLTFIFKFNHQGQLTNSVFFEILDLANIRIDTKIKCVACIQPGMRKVIQRSYKGHMCDHKFQGQPSRSHNFFMVIYIHDLENVRIDTKINFVSCLQLEIKKVMQKDVWPWFSRSYNKYKNFSLSPLDPLTPKTYPWEIFSKNLDWKAKIQGRGVVPNSSPPPMGVRRWIFTLGIWELMSLNSRRINREKSQHEL